MRFVWVTDIPTPYRNYTFERMTSILAEYGVAFEVCFMAWTEPRRTWRFTSKDLRFPHRVFRGLHPRVSGVMLHANPGLLAYLAFRRPEVVMVGGYSSPSHLLAPIAAGSSAVKILGCESNPASVVRRTGPVAWLKARAVENYDAYLVPSQTALDLLRALSPKAGTSPVVVFPNIIDDAVFKDGVEQARLRRAELRAGYGVRDGTSLWVIPARLAKEKGIEPFVDAFPTAPEVNVHVIVAGDGPERAAVEARIAARRVPVTLLGNVPQSDIVNLYAAADLMVLPSLADPSPLSVIEACAAGLPLYVSKRVGNLAEVYGGNGWVYDPDDPTGNTATMRKIAATPSDELARLGAASRALYAASFDAEVCIRRLAEQVVFLVENAGALK